MEAETGDQDVPKSVMAGKDIVVETAADKKSQVQKAKHHPGIHRRFLVSCRGPGHRSGWVAASGKKRIRCEPGCGSLAERHSDDEVHGIGSQYQYGSGHGPHHAAGEKQVEMNIRIMSQIECFQELMKRPDFWNVLSIRSPERNRIPPDVLKSSAKSFHPMIFHDVWREFQITPTMVPPATCHVVEALAWSEGKENILVHCFAGVSRSPALAYIIACKRMEPEEAMKILDYKLHFPNRMIVQIGAKVLQNPAIWDVFHEVFFQDEPDKSFF